MHEDLDPSIKRSPRPHPAARARRCALVRPYYVKMYFCLKAVPQGARGVAIVR